MVITITAFIFTFLPLSLVLISDVGLHVNLMLRWKRGEAVLEEALKKAGQDQHRVWRSHAMFPPFDTDCGRNMIILDSRGKSVDVNSLLNVCMVKKMFKHLSQILMHSNYSTIFC